MRRRMLILALAVGAAFAVPAVANADTYCVNAGSSCPTGGVELFDIQIAMDRAAESGGADTILLGAKDTPYFGAFTYQPLASRGGNRLALKGVGGRPALTGPVGETVLTVKDGDIEGIDILADFGEGLGLDVHNASVAGVKLIGPAEDAADARGIRALGPVRFENTEVSGRYETSLIALGALAGEEIDARGLRMRGAVVSGIFVGQFAHLRLNDSHISGGASAIQSQGLVEVRRSVLETTRAHSVAVAQDEATSGIQLDHVTAAHRGTPSGTDSALFLNSNAPVDTRLNAVALAGYTRGFRRAPVNGFPHNVVIRDSVWDPSRDELGGQGAGVFVESGNAHVAPALVNVAGDLHPRAGSAVIDRDNVSDISQFADLNGVPALDGDGDGVARPDAGAFEFRPTAPAPTPAPPGGGAGGATGGPAPDVTAPVLSGLRLRVGRMRVAQAATLRLAQARRLRLVLRSSEAAIVKIVPRRAVGGRLIKPRGSIARSVRTGKSSLALAKGLRRLGVLRPGRLQLIVTATDAAGNRSAKRVLKLRLSR